jgi:hypothetical protein
MMFYRTGNNYVLGASLNWHFYDFTPLIIFIAQSFFLKYIISTCFSFLRNLNFHFLFESNLTVSRELLEKIDDLSPFKLNIRNDLEEDILINEKMCIYVINIDIFQENWVVPFANRLGVLGGKYDQCIVLLYAE